MIGPQTRRPQFWSWAGAVAVILSGGISISLVLLAAQAIVTGQIGEPVSTILSSSLGAAIGAVGGYIGGVSKRSTVTDDHDEVGPVG